MKQKQSKIIEHLLVQHPTTDFAGAPLTGVKWLGHSQHTQHLVCCPMDTYIGGEWVQWHTSIAL